MVLDGCHVIESEELSEDANQNSRHDRVAGLVVDVGFALPDSLARLGVLFFKAHKAIALALREFSDPKFLLFFHEIPFCPQTRGPAD